MSPAASAAAGAAPAASPAAVAAVRKVAAGDAAWGSLVSDTMLVAKWTRADGWRPATFAPVSAGLNISPMTPALHYGTSVFEGMKLFTAGSDGAEGDREGEPSEAAEPGAPAALFRPHFHAQRLNASAVRIALPTVDEASFVADIVRLARHERDAGWLPAKKGTALYIRPLLFASEPTLGVRRSDEATLVVTCHPVGSYFAAGGAEKALRLVVDPKGRARAWKGGVGFAKTGGNYAATIAPADEAKEDGFDTVLWTSWGEERFVGECGQMNFFWLKKEGEEGRRVLCTPELDGTILSGSTRDAILSIACEIGVADAVRETRTPVAELAKAIAAGEVVHMFGSGTGAIVVPVGSVTVDGKEYCVKDTGDELAAVSSRIRDAMQKIYYQEEGCVKRDWMYDIDGDDGEKGRERSSC